MPMNAWKHKPAALWIMELAAEFDFCTDDEKRRLYVVLTQAWAWRNKR